MFMAEPMRASNSFVGTEEYIAPVCYYSPLLLYYSVPKIWFNLCLIQIHHFVVLNVLYYYKNNVFAHIINTSHFY